MTYRFMKPTEPELGAKIEKFDFHKGLTGGFKEQEVHKLHKLI